MKPLRLFTAVWGDKHLNWFKEACLKSLSWPQNKIALEGAVWSVLTKQEHRNEIDKLIRESGIRIKDVQFMILGQEFDLNPHAAGFYMKEAYIREISTCITFNAQSLTAPPDTIFGDGTVQHLRLIGNRRDVVVFAAHMRVLPEILDSLAGPLSNAQLVTLAMKHPHKTWTEAEVGQREINTYVGGLAWEYLDENQFSLTHLLPTPYLINFTPEDLVYFRNQIHYGVIDHDWPGECLIKTERQRLVGSSDGAFMVEITPAESNIPPKAAYHEDEPELFWRRKPHNSVNRMTKVILRGE